MTSYVYESERELRGRMAEFRLRARGLESGKTTDEHRKPYPDALAQARWFRAEIETMALELDRRK